MGQAWQVRELTPLLGVWGVFCAASGGLYLLAASLSQQIKDGTTSTGALSFPKSLDDLRSLSEMLRLLNEEHFYGVLGLFAAAYLYKQTFAIPGSFFLVAYECLCEMFVCVASLREGLSPTFFLSLYGVLFCPLSNFCWVSNVLAGALFGLKSGVPLVCCLTALGASSCYMLSWLFGKKLVWKYFSHRIKPLETQLTSDQSSLLFLLISLRLFPMSPNWFLNIASPLVGVPLPLFFISVFIGLLPYNAMCVQAGLVLSELQMVSVLDAKSVVSLLVATASLLLTALLVRRCRSRTKTQHTE